MLAGPHRNPDRTQAVHGLAALLHPLTTAANRLRGGAIQSSNHAEATPSHLAYILFRDPSYSGIPRMRKYLITGIVLLALLAPGLLMAQTDLTLESLAARDRKPDFQSRRSLCLTGRLRSAPGRRRNSHRADTDSYGYAHAD